MSAANAANAQAVRRPVPPTRPVGAPSAARTPVPAAAPVATKSFDHDDEEFRLNLSDIPRMQESLHIEGLKPTLLSRLLDVIVPLKP